MKLKSGDRLVPLDIMDMNGEFHIRYDHGDDLYPDDLASDLMAAYYAYDRALRELRLQLEIISAWERGIIDALEMREEGVELRCVGSKSE